MGEGFPDQHYHRNARNGSHKISSDFGSGNRADEQFCDNGDAREEACNASVLGVGAWCKYGVRIRT